MKDKRIILLMILIASVTLAVGYATVNNVTLSISGTSESAPNGVVYISSATVSDSNNANNPQPPTVSGTDIEFDINFTVQSGSQIENDTFYITYLITITNDSIEPYTFHSSNFNPVITNLNLSGSIDAQISGISAGDIIPAKTNKSFYLTINLHPDSVGDYNVGGGGGVEGGNEEEGTLLGSMASGISINLRGSTTTGSFQISAINTYDVSKSFNISINNNNFTLLDSSNNALGTLTIGASDEQTYTIRVRRNNGITFPADSVNFNVFFEPTDGSASSNLGIVTILVDKDTSLIDSTPPTISSFTEAVQNTNGSVTVSWNASDNVAIKNYKVETYCNNSFLKDTTLAANVSSTTITGITDNTSCYFVLTATDTSENTTTSQTNAVTYRWVFNITQNLSQTSSSNTATTINRGETFTTTYSSYQANNVSVVMGGVTLSNNNGYTYNNGTLRIPNVTGDLEITASGCLVKGTKIMLANGKYKNVEDIRYDDLLAVWSYDTGSITYEYPLWIEKEKETNYYTRISFSDNTYLDIAITHSLYDTKLNKFVDYLREGFYVGEEIAKINNDGKFYSVKITDIKEINEHTTYYFIGSTAYYNVIANNVLTTDGFTLISNLYGFDNNAKWPKEKEIIVNNPDNILSYNHFEGLLPHYLYKGFRVGEVGYLINQNIIKKEAFDEYIKGNITINNNITNPIRKNNKNMWMVTTSIDNVINKEDFLYEEGSDYRLPINTSIKKYYNTSDNKYYLPGSIVRVNHGMHFIAIK